MNDPAPDRIDSWKAIAQYLGRDISTVLRWAKNKKLPIHHVPGGKRQAVFAFKHEIDAWLLSEDITTETRSQALLQPPPSTETKIAADPSESEFRTRAWPQRLFRKAVLPSAIVAGALFVIFIFLLPDTVRLEATNPVRITRSQAFVLSPLLGGSALIYYQRYANEQYSVAAIPNRGGGPSIIQTGLANSDLCDLAPNGTSMLLRNLIGSRDVNEPLYSMNLGHQAHRVGNVWAYDAAWYPNRKRILYSANGVVYSSDPAGKSRRRLFEVPGNAEWFRWSPDGKILRFTVINKNEDTAIWELKVGNKKPHRLFPKMPYYQCCGSWTPDGKFYIFQVRVDQNFQVWARQERQSSLFAFHPRTFPLIQGSVSYRGPLISRDGEKLFLYAEDPKGELVRYDFQARQFVPMLPSISARTLAFSRDGNRIAYSTMKGDNLWQCHTDGTHCLQLTHGFRNTLLPRWSPDGRMIAFMGVHFTGNWGIYSVAAKGGPVRSLFNGNEAEGYPDWSPDGQRLVFSEVIPVAQPEGVHVLDLRTNKVSTLPGSKDFYYPRWSPDGRYIAAFHSGNHFLYLFDFDNSTWRPLAEIPGAYANWSHDGKEIYFLSNTVAGRMAFRIAIADDRRIREVASFKGIQPCPFILGDWMGLTPDDAPVAVQCMTTDNIYAWNLITK